MPNIEKIIAGLQILAIHAPGKWCCAEHDILYGPGDIEDFSQEEREKLERLRWLWDEDLESWYTFT